MERILLFIKHHFSFTWKIIEWGNGLIFLLLYRGRMQRILPDVLDKAVMPPYVFRQLGIKDMDSLYDLLHAQQDSDLKYFKPHTFDRDSLFRQVKNRSFLMMGAFDDHRLIGYFFLRFFYNKKSFVGRLIDKDFRGKGIGPAMNHIMYETAWNMGFRCLSTISKNNTAVIRAHSRNQSMKILKELQNDYMLVEFIRT